MAVIVVNYYIRYCDTSNIMIVVTLTMKLIYGWLIEMIVIVLVAAIDDGM